MDWKWLGERRILVITAVAAEKEAVLRGLSSGLREESGFSRSLGHRSDRVKVAAAGVGQAAAAACTAAELAAGRFGLVISAGIGGGFPGKAEVGTLVVSSEIVAADLGVEIEEGFLDVETLGFGSSRIPVAPELTACFTRLAELAGISARAGPVLTVSTATGTAARGEELARRVPEAAAEAMEGYGAAVAAQRQGIPCVELRSISNPVGPRDRSAWRIGDALAVLERAFHHLSEVLP